MILWLNPWALLGLASIAAAVLVHLMRRRLARRVVVPTVRFFAEAEQSAIRVRRIADPLLLLVRSAVLAAAALALAQPLLMTEARRAGWERQIARAVIVDVSDSMRSADLAGSLEAERASADRVTVIESKEMAPALARAAAWLTDGPPARHEIVVLSDFQLGALGVDELARVPKETGLRFVRVEPPSLPSHSSRRILTAGGTLHADTELAGGRTAVSYRLDAVSREGLELVTAPDDAPAIGSLLRVVETAGAAAPSADRPLTIRFRGAPNEPARRISVDDWRYGASLRLLDAVRDLGVAVEVSAASQGALAVTTDASPGSLVGAQVLQAALDACVDSAAIAEQETERISDETLAGWSRVPATPGPAAWRRVEQTDGRWFWAAALVLLAVEGYVRRTTRKAPVAEAHAA